MKHFKKLTALFIGLGALSSVLSGCDDNKATDALAQIKQNDVVRIGVFGDKPPFGYVDKQGQNQGFDVEIGKAITHDLLGDAAKVRFVVVEAANRVEYLQSDKVDIILANFTHTPARAEVVNFAKPYMQVALGIVSPKDAPIDSVDALKDKTLIVNKGTTADTYFTKHYPDIKLLKFEQNTETFEALRDKRGAAVAHDNTLLLAWSKENPGFTVGVPRLGEVEYIAPAVKKGNDKLLNWLNDEITTLSRDGRLQQAYQKTLLQVYGDDIKEDEILVGEK
ncbi:cysteine ABC transporter substrate-binding protein [Pasteurellaceae bacterium TAE3-ERU1]|nr:cysteine ABC transporter substrate-binding protein [Pasteurellaceae bacterium TAE3-ERU1]